MEKEEGVKMISELKFLSYLDVQASGEIKDMRDIKKVVDLATKMNQVVLSEKDVKYIQNNYLKLKEIYGIGGINYKIYSLK